MAYEVSNREESLRKGTWLEEEDEALTTAVAHLGERHWDALAKASGLRRSGKSCRLRWLNYLLPNLKHGEITEEEELIIIQLHQRWGNKWAKIAQRLPGRTDNEIKNYWRSHLRKKLTQAQQQEQGKLYKESFITIYNKIVGGSNVTLRLSLFHTVDFVFATRDAKQDTYIQFYGGFMQSSMDVGDCTYGNILSTPDNGSSCAVSELSDMSFGQDFEVKGEVSEWCWSYDQSQRKKQSLGCSSSCLSYPSWRFEEESDSSIWDCSTSFWS